MIRMVSFKARLLTVMLLGLLFLPCPVGAQDVADAEFDGQITLSIAGKAYSFTGLPKFSDYPAAKASSKKAVDIDWSSHKLAKTYKTRLREGLGEGADFNGHYKIVSHGCGSQCQGNWVVDVVTGRVLEQFYTSHGVMYRKDSSLLIADPLDEGEINHVDDVADFYDRKVTFYTVKKGRLVEVTVFKPQQAILDEMAKQ